MKSVISKRAAQVTSWLMIMFMIFGMIPFIDSSEVFAEDNKKGTSIELKADVSDEKEIEEAFNAGEIPEQFKDQLDVDDPVVNAEDTPAEDKSASDKGVVLNGTPSESDEYEEDTDGFEAVSEEGSYESISPDQAKTVNIDVVGKTVTYKFTAPADGYYSFYSMQTSNGDETDTYGRIVVFDSDTNSFRQIKNNDDMSDTVHHYKINFYAKEGNEFYLQSRLYDDDKTDTFKTIVEYDGDFNVSLTVSMSSKGIATVHGEATGDTFKYIYVDGGTAYESDYDHVNVDGLTSFTKKIDMKKYSVGQHKISVYMYDHEDEIFADKPVVTGIYKKPSNKYNYYYSSYNYVKYQYGTSYDYDYDVRLVLEYKVGSGKWKKAKGPFDTGKIVKVKGLKAGKTYKFRTYFAKNVKYGGKTHLISGKKKYLSKAIAIKTGGKKLAVKSLKTSRVKQYSRTFTIHFYNYGMYAYSRTYVVWYTEFKINLRLKRKPGAAGVYIGNVRLKGNKKKYSTTMTISGKMKGKKAKFSLMSYQHTKYYGYSKKITKKIRIK